MDKHESNNVKIVLAVLLAVCLGIGGFFAGKTSGRNQALQEREQLYVLNRSSMAKLSVGDGPVYVIGHRSPDSDTVCSAVAYAKFLTLLGYNAEAGVDVPPVLEDASGQSIFLVDHSEYAQAVEGLADAHIVGVLDHHGVGSITTGHQVVYEAKPIGATATIVWLDYLNYGFELDKTTAYLLLGAVLSDTDGLTGSTVTEADQKAVPALAEIAGVKDIDALYKAIHAEKLSYEGMSSEEILFSDYKEYEASGVKFGIGLVNAIDEETAQELAERMKEVLPDCIGKHDVDLMYASVGIRENGEKIDRIIPGNDLSKEMIEAAFPDYDEYDGTSFVFRTGLGRKTKFVPGLTDYLAAHPHE